MRTLADFLERNQDRLLERMLADMAALGPDPYINLMLETDEGKGRMRTWVRLAVAALNGSPEDFYQDQVTMGFLRTMQGYSLDDLSHVHKVYLQNVTRLILEEGEPGLCQSHQNLQTLSRLMFINLKGLQSVGEAFIAAREEIIAEKIGQMQRLHNYTRRLMSAYRQEDIVQACLTELPSVFRAGGAHLALWRQGRLQFHPPDRENGSREFLRVLAREAWRRDQPVFVDPDSSMVPELPAQGKCQILAAPIKGYDQRQGVLILSNRLSPMSFARADLDLLQQYLYTTAIVLENSQMIEAMAEHSRMLKLFTKNTIDVREKERKRISEDIHDTLTQTLSGLAYKLSYLSKVARTDQPGLGPELEQLAGTVRQAVDQSRNLIASLHPGIVDNVGLSQALSRLVGDYEEKLGFPIDCSIPESLELPSDVTIGLYRVIQEGLQNIHKHAQPDKVSISMDVSRHRLSFTVEDDGQGFAGQDFPGHMLDQGKFGLFYMQQRIELIGGEMRVHSRKGQGCTITGVIPLNQGGREERPWTRSGS